VNPAVREDAGKSDESTPQVSPDSELAIEAKRLATRAAAESLPFRLLGGLAVRLRLPSGQAPLFQRRFEDIDIIAIGASQKQIGDFAKASGYTPDRAFNAVSGLRRLIFYGEPNLKLEFFVNSFEMCHRIPMDRALLEPETIPLAELVLTKLQIVRLTEKDLQDALQLLHGHDVGTSDGNTVNAARVAQCCAGDWGLWRTATLNLDRCSEALQRAPVTTDQRQTISRRISLLRSHIDDAPKSLRWRARSRVGERLSWYEEPDEV
jgi:hypothetical protein